MERHTTAHNHVAALMALELNKRIKRVIQALKFYDMILCRKKKS